MTSILFSVNAPETSGDRGTVLKAVCEMPALSNVKLAVNNAEEKFYIADVSDTADLRAVTKALRGIRNLYHLKQGDTRDELESYVTRHAAMPAEDHILEMILSDPQATIGYMGAKKKDYEARDVKALFNHAAEPMPKDLISAPDDVAYNISRGKKAALLYKTSRNDGGGVVRSASVWLRARF